MGDADAVFDRLHAWDRARQEKRRAYHREYMRTWAKSPEQRERSRRYMAGRRAGLKQFAWDYKAERGCARCGERDPACLDFHHTGDKEFAIADKIGKGSISRARLLRELEVCEVLCANCHRKHHAEIGAPQ